MEETSSEDKETLEKLRRQLAEKDERNAVLRRKMNQVGNEYLGMIDELKATIEEKEAAAKAEEERKLVLEKRVHELTTQTTDLEKKISELTGENIDLQKILKEEIEESVRNEGVIAELKIELAAMKEDEMRRKERERGDHVANFFCGLGRALFDEKGEVRIGNLAQFGDVVWKAIPPSPEANEELDGKGIPAKKVRFNFGKQVPLMSPRESGSVEEDISDEDEHPGGKFSDSVLGELPGHVQDSENEEIGDLDEVQGQDAQVMENAHGSKDLKVILEKRSARRSNRLIARRLKIPLHVKLEQL